MKRFAIIGDNGEKIKQLFLSHNYLHDENSPDFVISYGGDGTLLRSETAYPSIPKLFIKNTMRGRLAQKKENEEVITKFFLGDYIIKKVNKIEALVNGKDLFLGAAEVTIHNANPRSGVRYRVRIDKEEIHHELIGDGVLVCNAIGATGYYKSITDSYFELGIGIAFNNSTEQADHVVVRNDRHIYVTITRGPGIIFGDNQEEALNLNEGDEIEFYESRKTFNIIEVN